MSILQPSATTISQTQNINSATSPGEIEETTETIGTEIDLEEKTTGVKEKIDPGGMKGENQENQDSQEKIGKRESPESPESPENKGSQEKTKRGGNMLDVITKRGEILLESRKEEILLESRKEEILPENKREEILPGSANSTTTNEETTAREENTTTIEETTETEETTIETWTAPEEMTEILTEPIETKATIELKTDPDTKRSEVTTPEKDALLSPGPRSPALLQEKTASTSSSGYFIHNLGRFCSKSWSQVQMRPR